MELSSRTEAGQHEAAPTAAGLPTHHQTETAPPAAQEGATATLSWEVGMHPIRQQWRAPLWHCLRCSPCPCCLQDSQLDVCCRCLSLQLWAKQHWAHGSPGPRALHAPGLGKAKWRAVLSSLPCPLFGIEPNLFQKPRQPSSFPSQFKKTPLLGGGCLREDV